MTGLVYVDAVIKLFFYEKKSNINIELFHKGGGSYPGEVAHRHPVLRDTPALLAVAAIRMAAFLATSRRWRSSQDDCLQTRDRKS